MLEYIQRDLGENPKFSVIWLHGLGADGHDFEPIVPELGLPPDLSVRFIFPHAPQQPVTINAGMVMPAWYDILSMEIVRQIDAAGIDRSAGHVCELVRQEIDRGIDSDHILLAGFSQGGAVVLHAGLLFEQPLMGILALSAYLPIPDRILKNQNNTARSIPIFMAHGTHDPVVPMQLGQQTYEFLSSQGCDVEWHTYPMQHSVNMDEIRDIGIWMAQLMRSK